MELSEIRKFVTWSVAGLFVFALYSEYYYKRAPAPAHVLVEGQDADVGITLISTDARALSCSSPEEIFGFHCEYISHADRWAKPPAVGEPLVPYKTTDDILLLVPGLFSDPALRQRLAIDPPVFGQEHVRFVANCKLHVKGKLKEIDVRWGTQNQWQTNKNAWVGTVSDCWLSDG